MKQEHASNLNFAHSMGDDEDIEQPPIFNFKLEQLYGRAARISSYLFTNNQVPLQKQPHDYLAKCEVSSILRR